MYIIQKHSIGDKVKIGKKVIGVIIGTEQIGYDRIYYVENSGKVEIYTQGYVSKNKCE